MANTHTTLTSLFSDIASAIREKLGGTDKIVADDFPDKIKEIETGVTLPTLSNPGSASTMLSGYQLIDGDNNVVTGTITTKTASNMTVSGATVTAPAGYYASSASKSVATATQATPSISVSSSGLITASATQSAGYVSAGTKSGTKQLTTKSAATITPSTSEQTAVASGVYTTGAIKVAAMPTATQATPSITVDSAGKITASATQSAGYVSAGTKTGTKQLTTQAAKTITPSTSSQTAVASGVYTTGAITVGAIPSTYVKPTSTKGATTYTPTSADQTISAGTYCSGVQTIKGDANLLAENIKSGVSIFGVAGSLEASSGGGVSGDTFFIKNSTGHPCLIGHDLVHDSEEIEVPLRTYSIYSGQMEALHITVTFMDMYFNDDLTPVDLSNYNLRYKIGDTDGSIIPIMYRQETSVSVGIITDMGAQDIIPMRITSGCVAEIYLEQA